MLQPKPTLKDQIKTLFETDPDSPVFKDNLGQIYSSFKENTELTVYLEEFIDRLMELIEKDHHANPN